MPGVTCLERAAAGLALSAALAGCQDEVVRPQLVLYVDVDMPVSSQADETISPDALFDSLRIEVLDAEGGLIDARVFSIASADTLPLAFGLRADAASDGLVVVRLRAFRAAFAENGELSGEPVLDPRKEVSVDRLLTLKLPAEGVVEMSVRLSGDCMGIPVRFGIGAEGDTTCLDGDHLSVDSHEGAIDGAPSGSSSGSWPLAFVIPCPSDAQLNAPVGTRCIPGGFSILGDPLFLAHNELERDALPLRPVALQPFFMDETEFTVGQLRELVAGGYDGPLPTPRDASDPLERYCTWDPASADDLPVNCISFELADKVCSKRGGLTPSEAQWEYAARGRGERNLFVWGEAPPDCCTSSIGYFPGGGCAPEGPELVASHPTSAGCVGDVSRDGVLDLNGSVSEQTRDALANYGDDCWASPTASAILHDHFCKGALSRIGRGASWAATIGSAALPIRREFVQHDPGYGFRCVFESAR